MRKTILLLSAFVFVSGLYAQSSFHNYFSQAGQGGLLYRCIQTSDGGFASVGKVTNYTTFDDDLLIIKSDAAGNAQWIKRISSPESEEFTDLAETPDGGLVATGRNFSMTTFLGQAIVEKFSASGIRQWAKSYTISGNSSGAKNVETDNAGNIYVLGNVAVSGASDDYFIMKLSAGGDILSQNTYGTPDSDFPLGFLRKTNGEMYICGWDNTFTGENIHLVKVNADMTLAWNKLIRGTSKYFAYDIKAQSNGDVVLAGRFDNGTSSFDILLFTIDDVTGDQVWAKSYSPVEENGTYAYGLALDASGMIAVTGIVEASEQGTFLFKTDAAGTVIGSNQCGTPGSTGLGYGIGTTADGGYLVCGGFEGYQDAIVQLIKTNSSGSFPCNSSSFDLESSMITLPMQSLTVTPGTPLMAAQDIALSETPFTSLGTVCVGTGYDGNTMAEEITVGPNPTGVPFTISAPGQYSGETITMLNSAGVEIFRGAMSTSDGMARITQSFTFPLAAGFYLVRIGDGQRMTTKKLVVK
jgi:hypothetical protein